MPSPRNGNKRNGEIPEPFSSGPKFPPKTTRAQAPIYFVGASLPAENNIHSPPSILRLPKSNVCGHATSSIRVPPISTNQLPQRPSILSPPPLSPTTLQEKLPPDTNRIAPHFPRPRSGDPDLRGPARWRPRPRRSPRRRSRRRRRPRRRRRRLRGRSPRRRNASPPPSPPARRAARRRGRRRPRRAWRPTNLHLQGAQAGAPGHRHLLQGHVHHELLHQRHLREAGAGGRPPRPLQQEAHHHLPRDPDLRAPRPSWRARQARRLRGH
ncbi:hypothetical protein GQ55_9G521600 [Panicum hallii var. hallii]|uniref:Uncharacterized protein n=1 Tax=Panicum hallii var. hallii TaxID=1504633 RepID=A0A2T7CEC2_9POAL|nr:hypothetical protein GQ55_9G521600 [Panicum hallii var. hallii]